LALTVAGCAGKQKLDAALAESQKVSAEKDSLLNEVLANAEMVSSINSELGKVKDLGANPVTKGEAGTTANDQRQVVLGKIRDAITRLQTSEDNLEKAKQRLAALDKKDSRLTAQITKYQQTIEEMKTQMEQQQTQYLATIDSQKVQIATLNSNLDTVTAQKTQVETEKQALVDTMNTVYYAIGTSKALKDEGVAVQEGSKFLFFGGTRLEPARDPNVSAFTVIHRINDTVIALPDSTKSYKIISRQNASYLSNEVRDGNKVKGDALHIANPEKFWGASKFLVVVQD
jgi:myosin heavy subunit